MTVAASSMQLNLSSGKVQTKNLHLCPILRRAGQWVGAAAVRVACDTGSAFTGIGIGILNEATGKRHQARVVAIWRPQINSTTVDHSLVMAKTMSPTNRRKDSFSTNCL